MNFYVNSNTPAEQIKALIKANVHAIMQEIAGDKVALCQCLDLASDKNGVLRANGAFEFRRVFHQEFAGLPVTDDMANSIFAFFEQQALLQFGSLQNARNFLDRLVEIKGPPTQAEIDRSWSIESASSEEGRRSIYGSSNPQEVLDQLTRH
jgi:hypothetical protein